MDDVTTPTDLAQTERNIQQEEPYYYQEQVSMHSENLLLSDQAHR